MNQCSSKLHSLVWAEQGKLSYCRVPRNHTPGKLLSDFSPFITTSVSHDQQPKLNVEARNYFSKVQWVTRRTLLNMKTYAFTVGHKHSKHSVNMPHTNRHTHTHTHSLRMHSSSEENRKKKRRKVRGSECGRRSRREASSPFSSLTAITTMSRPIHRHL